MRYRIGRILLLTLQVIMQVDLYAVDIHHWPWSGKDPSQSWKMENLAKMRVCLDNIGYHNTEIWSCEHAAYTGTPTNGFYISEIDRARWLVKSFNYNRLNGLNRVQWSQLLDHFNFNGDFNSPFNSMGLVDDGWDNGTSTDRRNTKRIAYWPIKPWLKKPITPRLLCLALCRACIIT
ncbi:hypothetical protein HY772_00140 [Candidatus Woesearchaeota archaeon]|nr:hypothetical protein [Candidatus Woesearchaeota archaeon]